MRAGRVSVWLIVLASCLAAEPVRLRILSPLKQLPTLTVRSSGESIGEALAGGEAVRLDAQALSLTAEASRVRWRVGSPAVDSLSLPPGRYEVSAAGIVKAVAGELEISAQDGQVRAVAILDIEDYVAGVLWGEGNRFREPEFLKALAIAVRSNARYRQRYPLNRTYHLVDSTRSAFFQGAPAPAVFVNASQATAGRCLLRGRKLVPGFFFAAAGGRTLLPEQMWGQRLTGFKEVFPVETLERTPRTVKWRDFTGLCPEGEGAVRAVDGGSDIAFFGADGSVRRVAKAILYRRGNARDYRVWISPYFRLRQRGPGVDLDFLGRGHQVGLSLTGSYILARRGWSAEQILGYFFDFDGIGDPARVLAGRRRAGAMGVDGPPARVLLCARK